MLRFIMRRNLPAGLFVVFERPDDALLRCFRGFLPRLSGQPVQAAHAAHVRRLFWHILPAGFAAMYPLRAQ